MPFFKALLGQRALEQFWDCSQLSLLKQVLFLLLLTPSPHQAEHSDHSLHSLEVNLANVTETSAMATDVTTMPKTTAMIIHFFWQK